MIKYALAVNKHFIQTLGLNMKKSNNSSTFYLMILLPLCVYLVHFCA